VREMASTMPARFSNRLAAKPRISYAEEEDEEPVSQSQQKQQQQQQSQETRRSARLASKPH